MITQAQTNERALRAANRPSCIRRTPFVGCKFRGDRRPTHTRAEGHPHQARTPMIGRIGSALQFAANQNIGPGGAPCAFSDSPNRPRLRIKSDRKPRGRARARQTWLAGARPGCFASVVQQPVHPSVGIAIGGCLRAAVGLIRRLDGRDLVRKKRADRRGHEPRQLG